MLRTIMKNYRNYKSVQATKRELSRLSNRELADIGISRADIPRLAREAAL